MKTNAIALAALMALVWQSAALAEVGFEAVNCPADNDVVVEVAGVKSAVESGTVSAKPAGDTISLTGGGMTAGDYDDTTIGGIDVPTHYVLMTSGAAKGRWVSIVSNTATDIVLQDLDALNGPGESFFGDITVGDSFEVIPHVTLDDVLPASREWTALQTQDNPSMVASTLFEFFGGLIVLNKRTTVFVFDDGSGNRVADGQNKAPAIEFIYARSSAGSWRRIGQNLAVDFGKTPIVPDNYVIIRNQFAAGDTKTDLRITPVGNLPLNVRTIKVPLGIATDLTVSTGRPAEITLDQLGLGGTTAFVDENVIDFFGNPLVQQDGDRLFLFDSVQGAGNNLSPSDEFYYHDGAWRKIGQGLTNFDKQKVTPGQGIVVRKRGVGAGSALWTNVAPY